MRIKNTRKLTISIRLKNEGEWKNEKPANRWYCKREREREREHNLEKLSFICDAQNKYEYINNTDYFAIFKLTDTKQLLLQDSLFYWPLEKNNINFRR